MVVVGIAAFLAGIAISEYYNRRIQKIISRYTRRPTQQRKKKAETYTQSGTELVRQGSRVGRKIGEQNENRSED